MRARVAWRVRNLFAASRSKGEGQLVCRAAAAGVAQSFSRARSAAAADVSPQTGGQIDAQPPQSIGSRIKTDAPRQYYVREEESGLEPSDVRRALQRKNAGRSNWLAGWLRNLAAAKFCSRRTRPLEGHAAKSSRRNSLDTNKRNCPKRMANICRQPPRRRFAKLRCLAPAPPVHLLRWAKSLNDERLIELTRGAGSRQLGA